MTEAIVLVLALVTGALIASLINVERKRGDHWRKAYFDHCDLYRDLAEHAGKLAIRDMRNYNALPSVFTVDFVIDGCFGREVIELPPMDSWSAHTNAAARWSEMVCAADARDAEILSWKCLRPFVGELIGLARQLEAMGERAPDVHP